MREIKLKNSNKFALVDNDVYEQLNQHEWRYHKRGYAVRWAKTEKGRLFLSMHRVIMQTPSEMHTDHRDGDGLNNRRGNLRVCTQNQNMFNRVTHKNNKCGYKGVYWQVGHEKWRVTVYKNKRKIHVGYFTDLIEAAEAYNEAALKHYGEFARLNIF